MTMLAGICLVAILACLVPCLYRIAVGPTTIDRLLAFDLVGVLVAVSVAVFAILQQSWVYLEISMGLSVLAFVGTLAVARYLESRRIF